MLRAHLDNFIVAYLNNILVYSKSKKEHIEHVKQILTLLNKANLRIKLEKYKFYKKKLNS